MTRLLTLEELIAAPRETPFEPSPSFTNAWWTRPDAPQGRNVRYFQVRDGLLDVVRLRVFDPAVIWPQFDDFDADKCTVEIDRIETRVESRFQGYARSALTLLCEEFDTCQVVAFSHADEFWERTGFAKKHRQGGTGREAAFFVWPPMR
ncbi:hypothetical protein [Microbacterium sp.]|uniref:hypothetical protein n=1 Tax=Microbacterium sp. TaxID=51671 RepID=UPI003561C4FC